MGNSRYIKITRFGTGNQNEQFGYFVNAHDPNDEYDGKNPKGNWYGLVVANPDNDVCRITVYETSSKENIEKLADKSIVIERPYNNPATDYNAIDKEAYNLAEEIARNVSSKEGIEIRVERKVA